MVNVRSPFVTLNIVQIMSHLGTHAHFFVSQVLVEKSWLWDMVWNFILNNSPLGYFYGNIYKDHLAGILFVLTVALMICCESATLQVTEYTVFLTPNIWHMCVHHTKQHITKHLIKSGALLQMIIRINSCNDCCLYMTWWALSPQFDACLPRAGLYNLKSPSSD